PEAGVLECEQLVGPDEPIERLLDQLLALPDVVEDSGTEGEEASVDPEPGAAHVPYALHELVVAHGHHVKRVVRPDGHKAGELVAPPEVLDVAVQGQIGELIRV